MLPICNLKLVAKKPCRLPFPDEKDKTLGAELKRRRLALEWTQEATARYFGVLKDSYQGWEWNNNVPQFKYRKKVVDFLEFNFWDDGSNSLANRCLLYRVEHGLSHEQLAKRVNVSMVTIGRIENGKRKVLDITIEKVERTIKLK
jgi:transcriptional regulator with XRE-family HTH domain